MFMYFIGVAIALMLVSGRKGIQLWRHFANCPKDTVLEQAE